MPTLGALECSLEKANTGDPFDEYGIVYGDGVVEAYIAIPSSPQTFTIRLKSKGYISEGLATLVFMDGEYQCNRNRLNLKPPKKGLPRSATAINFCMRQKEKPVADGSFIGREWRFDTHNQMPDVPRDVHSGHFDSLGTIEVLVLRCSSNDDTRSSSSSGLDVDPLNKSDADDTASGFEDAIRDQDKDALPAYVSPTVTAEDEDGGLFGGDLFAAYDGANDGHDQASIGGDGPNDGYDGYWSYHPYPRNTYNGIQTWGPQPGYVAPHPTAAFPPQAGPLPTGPGKRVHFEMGGPPNTRVEAPAPQVPNSAPGLDHSVHGGGQQGGYPVFTHPVPFDTIPLYAGPPMPGTQIPATQIPATQMSAPQMPGPYMPTYGGQAGWGGQAYIPYSMHPGYGHGYGAGSGHGYYPASFYQGQGYGQGIGSTAQGMSTNQNEYSDTNTGGPAENKSNQDSAWQDQNNTGNTPSRTGGDENWSSKDTSGSNSGGDDNWANPGSKNNDTSGGNDGWGSSSNNNDASGGNDGWGSSSKDNDTSGGNDGWGSSSNNNDASGRNDGWNSGSNNNTSGDNAEWNSGSNNNASGGNDGWDNDATNDTNNAAANDNASGNNNGSTWGDDKKNTTSGKTNYENANGVKWGETSTTSNPPLHNSGNNGQPDQNWGAKYDPNPYEYQTQNKQGNDWSFNKGNITATGFNPWTPVPPVQSMPGSFPQARALYGPHGPYYLPHPSTTPHNLPPTVEEEPRYDVPVSHIAATHSTHQVVPGRGYIYSHRIATPVYMDTVSNPYARFVFKYRNPQQLTAEIGVNVNGQPTNEEMLEFAAKSKEEVIEMLLRAKAALGGRIPEPTKPEEMAKEKNVEPIVVPAPARRLKEYSIPLRAASQSRPSNQTLGGSVLRTPDWGHLYDHPNMNSTQPQEYSGTGYGWQGGGSGNANVNNSTHNSPQNTNMKTNTVGGGWIAPDQTQAQTQTWGGGFGGNYGDPGPRPVSEAGSLSPQSQGQNGGATGGGQDWGATSGAAGGAPEASGQNW